MTRFRGVWVAVVPVVLLTAACAGQDGAGVAPDAAPLTLPADVAVLRIDQTGGFVRPETNVTRLPSVSVYSDGRVITQGPTILSYPGPALPNLQVRTVSAAEVTRLVEQARAAGVGSPVDVGTPTITDVTTTRFTIRETVGSEQLEVYALGEATGPEAGLTPAQQAAREKLRTFADKLTDPGNAATQSYQPTAIAAVAAPWVATPETAKQPRVAWPGPALPGASLGAGLDLGCVTVTGDAVKQLIDAAGRANAATAWTSGGKPWAVTLRPLLPDETDCASLSAGR
ncbi:hypothetical protein [Micromonospora humidisoli]|uniref:Uncharacterized protein n=1 Tax=Micromonospora humidisoli TaxID=2807622 RepID=A0ABS2JIR1_9ACTN|nr:hypothetical protein [Micromonospora humidisoli]